MAVRFDTKTPNKLLKAIKNGIDNDSIRTWTYDSDGDFTHSPEQWRNRAWMRPRVSSAEALIFNILGSVNEPLSKETYGVFHGRLVEMFLAHADALFDEAIVSALFDGDDQGGS